MKHFCQKSAKYALIEVTVSNTLFSFWLPRRSCWQLPAPSPLTGTLVGSSQKLPSALGIAEHLGFGLGVLLDQVALVLLYFFPPLRPEIPAGIDTLPSSSSYRYS